MRETLEAAAKGTRVTSVDGSGAAADRSESRAESRPLKILYHHRTQSRDGQFVHIQELISALQELGHEVRVVEPRHGGATQFGGEPKAARAVKKYIPGHLYELLELVYNVPELVRLLAAGRAFKPDVLYERANIYTLSGLLAAKLLGLRYFLEVNSPLADERGKFGKLRFPRLAAQTERACWRAADIVFPVTQVLSALVQAAGVRRERIVVVPNGVDLRKFTSGDDRAMRRRLSLEGKLVLGFTGFVREWHRANAVIDLLAGPELPANSHFLIVGDGPAKDALYEQARRLNVADRLTITGIVPRDQVARYIECFDIALQPNVVSYASPLKLLEYMALARAIIAPDSANIRELLVHGHNALLVAPDHGTAYADAVKRLAGDAALRAALGAAARQTIFERRLTWDQNARTVAALACASPVRSSS